MKKRLLLFVLMMTTALLFSSCGKNDGGYKTSGNWAMYDNSYMFAVEVDGFNGDIFKAGKYFFKLVAGRTKAAGTNLPTAPAVFDVYVGNKIYNSVAEMQQEIPGPQITVGGMGSADKVVEYELHSGQYVYILPYQVVYEPSGYITFELIK